MEQSQKHQVQWSDVYEFVDKLPRGKVYGIPRGGAVLAGIAAARRDDIELVVDPSEATIIIDDVIDSGATMKRYADKGGKDCMHFVMFDKLNEPRDKARGWIEFPWEGLDPTADNVDHVTRVIELIGEDPTREGLLDTPKRYINAMLEMTSGYHKSRDEVLGATFDAEGYDEVVVLKDIEFVSLCEHHMLPFIGRAHVAYLPDKRIVGLSKMARLVEMHARRLQVQERLTQSVAHDIQEVLNPLGVAVVIEAHHTCMGSRGVKKPTARMVTSTVLGVFRDKPAARAEVLSLMKG